MKKLFLALPFLALSASGAFAQSAVQQSAVDLEAATGLYGQANGATSCNTVSQTAANDTVTITPPGSQYVVIDGIFIKNTTNATGVTQTGTISMTNVTGAPFLNFGSALTTVQGQSPLDSYVFPHGLKGSAPGVAVTLVPSATQSANNYLCIVVAAHFSY